MLDLDCLFPKSTLPLDRTGSLQSVAELLADLGPGLMVLARNDGQALAVDAANSEIDPLDIVLLEDLLLQKLAARRFHCWPEVTQFGQRLAFATRLPFETRGAVLAGFVAYHPQATTRLEELAPALVSTGRLVWRVLDQQANIDRVEARNHQLRAEYQTIRLAHSNAVTQALDEQQKRVEAQRLYARQLETEVAERSAALRHAVEEAQAQKEELERYSVALQSTNQALEEFSHAAEAANRAKSEFLANMSHELRTPLTAILGHCEIMKEDVDPGSSFVEPLGVIERNGSHLLNLINDVLDLAKIEAGKLELENVRCSPLEMIADLEKNFAPRLQGKPVELRVRRSNSFPLWIETDATRLQQILINLLSNAVKFTSVGSVTLSAQYDYAPGSRMGVITFTVADTGIGIPADKLRKVFEPFEQADTSTARQFGGTGLGLSICRRLAERLGGRIEVESHLNQGSTFRLILPALTSRERLEPDSTASGDIVRVSGSAERGTAAAAEEGKLQAHVLVAEDSLDNRRLISAILSRAQAKVTVVENGQEVVDAVLAAKEATDSPRAEFDVILMDMQMPVLDGYQATRTLRDIGCRLPIIALTAHAMKGDREQCLKSGCDDYATKPINKVQLLDVIQKQLRKHRSQ